MLLCNYFNYIDRTLNQKTDPTKELGDIESYICYGEAVPGGEGWFVLRRDKSIDPKTKKPTSYTEIWDSATGECFVFGDMSDDPQCPLKKLWCVVGMENVWANVQEVDIPQSMKFDLENPKNWEPFLNESRKTQFFGSKDNVDKLDRRVWRSSRKQALNMSKNKKNRGPKNVYQEDDIIYPKPVFELKPDEIIDKQMKVEKLEKDIKKYLAGKFEDERISAVKKTTNWYR